MPVKSPTPAEEAEFPFEQKTVNIAGRPYTFRELSVQENDDCADGAKDEAGRINGRTMMRLMILTSSVEPKLSPEALAKMPQRVYAKIYDVVNELADPETLDDSPVAVGEPGEA